MRLADSEGAFLKWLTAIIENRIRDQRDFHKAARRDMGKQSPLENPRSDGSVIPLEIPDKSSLPTASRVMMVCEDMLLSIPIHAICRPDCQGLCAQCGQNLNDAACNCRPDEIDPRLAPLQQLLQAARPKQEN